MSPKPLLLLVLHRVGRLRFLRSVFTRLLATVFLLVAHLLLTRPQPSQERLSVSCVISFDYMMNPSLLKCFMRFMLAIVLFMLAHIYAIGVFDDVIILLLVVHVPLSIYVASYLFNEFRIKVN